MTELDVLNDIYLKLNDVLSKLLEMQLQITNLTENIIYPALKFLMFVAAAFLVWQVIKILWGFFYGWLFRGV